MKEYVNKVNEILDSYGDIAIQERGINRGTLYGYIPVYLLRAIREAGGIIRLMRIVEHAQAKDDKSWHAWAIVEVVLSWGDGEVSLQHAGGSRSPASEGEALKGAITNALIKAFSVIGIGEKAYMGLLKGENTQMEHEPGEASEKMATDKATTKQVEYIAALGRTIQSHPELEAKYAQELKGFREQIQRGMTKHEASIFINWCKEKGIQPQWPIGGKKEG